MMDACSLPLSDTAGLFEDATEAYIEAYQRKLDRHLRGAWRAGYDYLHIYTEGQAYELSREVDASPFKMDTVVFPSNTKRRPNPDGYRYMHTYDIASADDDEIRRVVRDA